ncbi:MAG: hypothetical protein ACOZAJ_03140 [Patescibacteria group bacterium]
MSKKNIKISCPDCGPAPTPHRLAWLTCLVDWLLKPYIKFLEKIVDWLRPFVAGRFWHWLAHQVMKLTVKIGLAEMVFDLREDHNSRTKALWQEAKRRGIVLKEWRLFKKPTDIMIASQQGYHYVFDGLPRPPGKSSGLDWMDDKAIMREKFKVAGLPIARGGSAVLVKKALHIFDTLGGPLVVKPRFGSRSRHTFRNIITRSQLVKAFYSAQKLSPWVVIEEQLKGEVYRATVVKGKLQAVARRELASVIGDGLSSLGELVNKNNQLAGRKTDMFPALTKDDEATSEIFRQGYNWQSVPAKNVRVFLSRKVNRGSGGATVEVTSEVHQVNRQLFEKAAEVVNDHIIGIDIILEDISQPWHTQAAVGIIECNSLPFIDLHHFPLSGQPKNVAGAIWDLIWPLEVQADPVSVGINNHDHRSYPYRKDV